MRAGAKELWDEQMFEFDASHKLNWISVRGFGCVQFMVPEKPEASP